MSDTSAAPADTSVFSEPRLLIGGALVQARAGRTFTNINPATEQVLGLVADAGADDMDAAIAAARTAFDATDWSTNTQLRLRCLRQLSEALERHKEELRGLTVAEIGAPVSLTHGPHLDAALGIVSYTADLAEKYIWDTDHGVYDSPVTYSTSRRVVAREPVGVVAAITPWNVPMQINLAKVVPALAAGNTVVLKPAPDSPWTATVLGRLVAEETDIPAGVFNVVTTSDNQVAQRLAEDPRVDMISFTGSTAVGRRLMAAAAGTIKKTFLELGGKSAHIVCDDADLGKVIPMAATVACFHSGQGCAIDSRLLVARPLYDDAVAAMSEALANFPYGDPTDPSVLMGPQISALQRQRVLDLIAVGVAEGQKVAVGGGVPAHLPTGFFTEPTLFVDVDPDSAIAQQEFFGPVAVMIPFDTDDDAVRIANNSIYGLAGSVSSGSLDRAMGIARRVRTGSINVNGGQYYAPDMPFGGYRQSGLGREMGVPGFEEYLETKVIAVGV
ncbi:aldehyde dehydrogenase [Frankia sp. R43]|uniref:aldehyde dehydrogenase family protein n=1 Tax=Frankia sp. R43 TaxID=269536 RepID=UPI0006CA445F|nr:aldehyde dehydrogenase family protein [Frankia sp. R43]KPM54150.1 aldehyde dehydrogenase [Frankia sp. R43]